MDGEDSVHVAGLEVDRYQPLKAIGEALEALEARWLPESPDREGSFKWVPAALYEFTQGLMAAVEHAPGRRYLEVGCGIGTKLAIAHHIGFEVTGLEVRPEYAEVARALVPQATVVVDDALEWEGYADFDVVYTYQPFDYDIMQTLLDRRLTRLMRPDAILFHLVRDMGSHGWRRLGPHVWDRP